MLSNETRQQLEAQAIVAILCYMILVNRRLKKLHKLAQVFLDLTAYGLIVTAADNPGVSILSGLSQCYGAIPREQIQHVDKERFFDFSDFSFCNNLKHIAGRDFSIDDIHACMKAFNMEENVEDFDENFLCLFLKCFTLRKHVLQQIIESLDETSTPQTILEFLLSIPEFAGPSSNDGESMLVLSGLHLWEGDYCGIRVFSVPPHVPKIQASRRR